MSRITKEKKRAARVAKALAAHLRGTTHDLALVQTYAQAACDECGAPTFQGTVMAMTFLSEEAALSFIMQVGDLYRHFQAQKRAV